MFNFSVWRKERFKRYKKAEAEGNGEVYGLLNAEVQRGRILFYKGQIIKILMNSIQGGISELNFMGSLKIEDKNYIMLKIYDYYDSLELNPYIYLYEFNNGILGKKINPKLPVGTYEGPSYHLKQAQSEYYQVFLFPIHGLHVLLKMSS